MANVTCTQRLKVCHLRILRLDDDGTLFSSAESRYEYGAPATFSYTATSPERERFEQIDGCGNQCALYIGPPKAVDSAELALTVCNDDAEVTELLAGGSVIDTATGGGDTIGYLASTDATVNVNGVAVEVWSYQWNGRQRALRNGSPAFYRHTFPMSNWEVDQKTMENAMGTVSFTGIAQQNTGFGTGYAADAWPVSMGQSVYGWFIDDSMPASSCGYQAVA